MARSEKILLWLGVMLVAAVLLSLHMGRYPLDMGALCRSLADAWSGNTLSPDQRQVLFLFFNLRLPRIVTALLVGASLAVSGSVYQAMFQNPLVSPGILGVQHGAAFGGAVGILAFSSMAATQVLVFIGGALGVGLALFFSMLYPKARFLALLIGGMVSSSFFVALTSLVQYVADPNRQLPEIVFWLMGSLSRAEPRHLAWGGPLMLCALAFICLNGKVVNALSMGDDEAMALGVNSVRMKMQLIAAATLACSLTVVMAGVINWVGLVIPHVMRFICGPDNRLGLLNSALGGALFILLTDSFIRTIWTVELPLGIATSIILLPLFAFSLWYDWKRRYD